MPWYWSDDIARVLLDRGKLPPSAASTMLAAPVAFRSDLDTIEEAIDSLLEDDEIPLLAA